MIQVGATMERPMRILIFTLAALVPSFAVDPAGSADKPPVFDIVRNCKAEAEGAAVEPCKKGETDAKTELAKRWTQFGATNKKACIGESSTGGDQSYVELLTCLEMSTGQFKGSQQQ
jgi:hypothetical protein